MSPIPAHNPQDQANLASFGPSIKAVVIGGGGGLGSAFVDHLSDLPNSPEILALARRPEEANRSGVEASYLDLTDEGSIKAAADQAKALYGSLNLVLVATGILHDGPGLQPEKSWRAMDAEAMHRAFAINTVGPALVAKHFLPLLASGKKSAFAAISARVGSISDNGLGGWHAYRASKSALNMILKTLSIELARKNPDALVVGLHPGTVDTNLSKPFQGAVPEGKLFTPAQSAGYMLNVLDGLTPSHSGGVFAWDGMEIPS